MLKGKLRHAVRHALPQGEEALLCFKKHRIVADARPVFEPRELVGLLRVLKGRPEKRRSVLCGPDAVEGVVRLLKRLHDDG